MTETSRWEPVKELMTNQKIIDLNLYDIRNINQLNLYKTAAKIIGKDKRVLDISCGSGLGTWILAKECGYAAGVEKNIDDCIKNWECDIVKYYKTTPEEKFDAIVNFHCHEFNLDNLKDYGLLIVETFYLSLFYNDTLFTHAIKFPIAGMENIYVGIKRPVTS